MHLLRIRGMVLLIAQFAGHEVVDFLPRHQVKFHGIRMADRAGAELLVEVEIQAGLVVVQVPLVHEVVEIAYRMIPHPQARQLDEVPGKQAAHEFPVEFVEKTVCKCAGLTPCLP